jgi:hypothetical protein
MKGLQCWEFEESAKMQNKKGTHHTGRMYTDGELLKGEVLRGGGSAAIRDGSKQELLDALSLQLGL